MEKLLDYFTPNHYDLNFNINKDARSLKGEASINGTAHSSTIKLHAKSLDISSIKINGMATEFEVENDTVIIKDLQPEQITIDITYSHQLNSSMQGAYLSTYQYNDKTETIVATQFESHYARECFPCIDEPAAKATFAISISSSDPDDTIISNMPLKTTENNTSVFETTPIMSTYLVAFAVGKLKKHESTSKHGINVTTYSSLSQPDESLKFATDFAAKSLDFFDDLFKTPYPLPKCDQLALPDFESGAMENWGLVTYREQCLLCDKDSALDQKLYVATVIAHELSHQWFGNLVTMQWWDDLWLNESFASLMEIYAVDKIAPELNAWDDFYSSTVVSALRRDCLPNVQPVKCEVNDPAEISTLFDGAIVYSKGARLLYMLLTLMGEENFFSGISDYFNQHAYKNTVSDDLWDALTPHANFDIKALMTPWLTQPGYPVLSNGNQHQFLIAKDESPANYSYPIPEIRDDLSGHYIINLPKTEFEEALQNFNTKTKEQKLRILLDRELLAKTPEVNASNLLNLLDTFKNETDFIIWDILTFLIADLKIFFPLNTPEKQQFKKFIQHIATSQYERLGLTIKENEPDNDTKLRAIILGLMSFSDDAQFKSAVKSTFANTPFSSIDPNIRHIVFATLTKLHEKTPVDTKFSSSELLKTYQDTSDPELKSDLMTAFTSVRSQDTIKSYLPLLKDGSIRPDHRIFVFARLVKNPHGTDIILNWLYDNWDWLVETEGDKTLTDYPRIAAAAIQNQQNFTAFKDFFTPKLNEPGLNRTLKIAFSEISARLELIENDSPEVYKTISLFTFPPEI